MSTILPNFNILISSFWQPSLLVLSDSTLSLMGPEGGTPKNFKFHFSKNWITQLKQKSSDEKRYFQGKKHHD